jgi:hypothetical protein
MPAIVTVVWTRYHELEGRIIVCLPMGELPVQIRLLKEACIGHDACSHAALAGPLDLHPITAAPIGSLPSEVAIHLRGLGEEWAVVFDIVDGCRVAKERWSDLKTIRELHALDEPTPEEAQSRRRNKPARAAA